MWRVTGSVRYGQRPHPDTRVFEDCDASAVEVRRKVAEICQQKAQLMIGMTLCRQPEQDDGRPGSFSQGEDRTKIGVGGYQDAAFLSGAFENYLVGVRRHAVVTYMRRVVSGLPQTLGNRRRQSIVDQKPQGVVTRGISRSRTASAA